MNWFIHLRRWIRIYICFLLPVLAIGIALYFQEFITVTIFACLTLFITLPLFVYSEEIRKEERDNEYKLFLQKTVIANQKTQIGILRSNSETESMQETKQKITASKTAKNMEIGDSFPVRTVISGMALEENRKNVLASQIGDIVSISHSDKADYSNTFCVVNERTGAMLGSLSLKLGMHFIDTYGKATQFIGEVVEIQNEKSVVCEIIIQGIKAE